MAASSWSASNRLPGDRARMRMKRRAEWTGRNIGDRPAQRAPRPRGDEGSAFSGSIDCALGQSGQSPIFAGSAIFRGAYATGYCMPSLSAIRTSSARERAAILRMIWPRWTPMVISLVPSSPAVCLFAKPATTKGSTWRSRGVRS